jgi:hypothetical protein
MNKLFYLVLLVVIYSCTSTKSTIKNVDNSAVKPKITNKAFVITETAKDKKYGYEPDYPINIGLILEPQEEIYIGYFFNGLEGPNGELLQYKKIDTCCPFPTEHNTIGAGTLVLYEVSFNGSNQKETLYFNIYEKGKIMCPKGFTIKKDL